MKTLLKLMALAAVVSFSLHAGSKGARAQETPTPAPWDQATLDAAINELMTQTAVAPTLSPTTELQSITFENLDQLVPLASYAFQNDAVYYAPMLEPWSAIDHLEQISDESRQLTIYLLDHRALGNEPIIIPVQTPVEQFTSMIRGATESRLFVQLGFTTLQVYDIGTGELLSPNLLRRGERIQHFQIQPETNHILGLMSTDDEVVIWDGATLEVLHRSPVPRYTYTMRPLPNNHAITTDTSNLHAINLETGEIVHTWEYLKIAHYSAQLGRLYLRSTSGEITVVDASTFETLDQFEVREDISITHVTADGQLALGWNTPDTNDLLFQPLAPTTAVFPEEIRAHSFELNPSEDLLLTRYDGVNSLYHLSSSGVEPVHLPEALRTNTIYFRSNGQMVSVDYIDTQNIHVTIWGVPA